MADLDIPPPNDIEATGHCCCNGCIGEGMCDLAEPEERAAAWRWDKTPAYTSEEADRG